MLVRATDEVTREPRNYCSIVIAKALRAKDKDGWPGFARYLLEHFQRRHAGCDEGLHNAAASN